MKVDPPGLVTGDSLERMLRGLSFGSAPERQPADALPRIGRYDPLWQLSMADPHTGLVNQLLLQDRLSGALSRRIRRDEYVVVIHICLTNLSAIQTMVGYRVGNVVLSEVCERLLASVRDEDTLARVGATDFVAVMSTTSESAIPALTNRFRSGLASPVSISGDDFQVSARLGVVVAGANESAEQVLARAGKAA